MNAEKLALALAETPLEYIDEAINYRRARKARPALRAFAAAACLALSIYAGARALWPQAAPEPTPDANLPVLELDAGLFTDGQGSFLLRMRSFSEYSFGSPWSADAELAALPVFANPVEYAPVEQNRAALSWDEPAMRERLLGLAASLGTDAGEDDIVCSLDADGALWSLSLSGGGVNIEVLRDLSARVNFETPLELPVDFGHDSPREDYEAAGEYFAEHYAARFGIENPRWSVGGGEYKYDGVTQRYSLRIYEAGKNVAESLVNYCFGGLTLIPGEDGGLRTIRLEPVAAGSLGNYPLISLDEATELVLNGGELPNTLSTLRAEDMTGVTLAYHIGMYDEYYMPYYCFAFVEREPFYTETLPEGFTGYSLYYVPAVSGEYLSPSWDGGVN